VLGVVLVDTGYLGADAAGQSFGGDGRHGVLSLPGVGSPEQSAIL
jgi:hypothetical protein